MRENNGLSSTVRATISYLLGPTIEPSQHATSILGSVDDHLFIWNSKDKSILAVNLSCGGDQRIQTLNLAECPQHSVTGLSLSRSGRWISVYGQDGVTAVQVPRRSGCDGRLGGGDSELLCRSVSIVRNREGRKVQKAAWHPGSQGENHLVLLTTDGSLSLVQVGEQVHRTVQEVNLGGSRLAAALGETSVDFCYGAPVETDEGNVWPIFVLWGDGDVFHVNGSLAEDWRVEGPVEVESAEEKDLSVESCSIHAVGGRSSPSVLVVARVGGSILHYLMLGDTSTGRLSLHLYEKVELDLGPLNACDSVFSCPVRLVADYSSQSRYMVMHDSGLHTVQLPVISQEEPEDPELQCVVEHLICTRPTADSPPAPLLGATVTYPPSVIQALLADHTLHSIVSKPSSFYTIPAISRNITSQTLPSEGIDEKLRSIFSRGSTQPLILSAAETKLTPTATLELLCRATETLQREYIDKIVRAREELAAHVKILQGKKQSQAARLGKLETARTELRERAEWISEKYEDVRDRSSTLSARAEAVLAKVQSRVTAASDAELKMARDLKLIQGRMEQMKLASEQLKEKEKYQRYQIENISVKTRSPSLSKDQSENMKEVLHGNSLTINDLVKSLRTCKKDLTL